MEEHDLICVLQITLKEAGKSREMSLEGIAIVKHEIMGTWRKVRMVEIKKNEANQCMLRVEQPRLWMYLTGEE